MALRTRKWIVVRRGRLGWLLRQEALLPWVMTRGLEDRLYPEEKEPDWKPKSAKRWEDQ